MIFTSGVQDLHPQAFPPISVKLCCKGLSEMSKRIGIGLLGSVQGIPTPLRMLPAGGIACSVPYMGVPLGLVCCLGSWDKHGELWLLKIQELHLRGQTLASLSSLLTWVSL